MADRFNPLTTKYPIWNAGMGAGMAGPELVNGISKAGGFGVLGVGGLPSNVISELVKKTRQLTSQPFGANIILPMSNGQDIASCFDEKVEVIVLFWGDPQPFVKDAHKRGVFLVTQCGDVEEASTAASNGVDAIIIQGIEAGGHVKGEIELSLFLEEAHRELGKIPLIAAGGISSGKEIAKFLTKRKARAVSLGTRFAASTEARASNTYKESLVASSSKDTVLTSLYNVGWRDAKHRVIRTKSYEDWVLQGSPASGSREDEGMRIGKIKIGSEEVDIPKYSVYPPILGFEGDERELPFYAGQSVQGIQKIESIGKIVEQLVKEMQEYN